MDYVDFRYPFHLGEWAIIASGGKDKYNDEVDPRTLPLRSGILILRKQYPVDTNTQSGLESYTRQDSGIHTRRFPLPLAPRQRGKRLKTDPSLDCRLCQEEGCSMLCGCVAMEVVLSIAKTTATRFQMQGAINLNCPLPIPTPTKAVDLRRVYNLSAARGYLFQQHYASLAEKMRVLASFVRQWLNEERMRMGHQGNYHKYPSQPKRRGKPPAVEVRTKLPLSRQKAPSATHTPEAPSATNVPKVRGEYYEEDTPQKVELDVL